MEKAYRELEFTCPFCEKVKNIKIPEALFSKKKFGTIKIQVPQGGVCREHQFIVFIDTKGIIRGYEKIDMLMKTVEREIKKFYLSDFINRFGLYGIFCLIHAKIFNYPAYIIRDKNSEDLSSLINRIGNRLLPEAYREGNPITFLEEIDYKNIKLKEKNAFLMDAHQHILQTPWEEKEKDKKPKFEKKLKFEEDMIKKALDVIDEDQQITILQQNILSFIKEAEYTKRILENVDYIYEEDLMERMSRELMKPKPNHYRIYLIKDFIKQRFSPELASKIKSKVEEFLSSL